MRKKHLILLIAIAIILLPSLSITYMYYLMEENTNSVITFGNIKVKLIEQELRDGKYIDISNNDIVDITNTSKLDRIIKAKNIGNNAFYLRLKIEFNGTSDGNNFFDANDLITIQANDDWIYQEGYYYYKKPLDKNEETSELTREILLDRNRLYSNYKGYKFYLDIKAQAVQSEHNVEDVMEVTNWPS